VTAPAAGGNGDDRALAVRGLDPASDLDDWDALAVEAPGGHVFQSRAWAAHRARSGWRPRFWALDAGGRVLALVRPWAFLPGSGAYLPRGPVPTPGADVAGRLLAVVDALGRDGVDVVAADPEVAASDEAYRLRIASAGFHPIEELQPSRHRLALALPPGGDEEAVFAAISRSTRQRIRGAERAGLRIVRYDTRITGEVGDGLVVPTEAVEPALDRFATMLEATGDRRGFRFDRPGFLAWWSAAHAAGHLVLLEARHDGEPIAGLLLYRHGERLSTAHSADRADTRRSLPGSLHLLRWRAAQLALREDRSELDLGGVDVVGARRPPVEGEPMWGLYQHKLSFGAHWVEQVGAQERVVRGWRYGLGRVTGRVASLAGRP
jgi:lipid II:glycine glycyltransferase (peptidoglycan interpeptide bridge formation enzyme)